MIELPDIAGMSPGEAYRHGFAEAQQRGVHIARLVGALRGHGDDSLAGIGSRKAAEDIAAFVGEMQPVRA